MNDNFIISKLRNPYRLSDDEMRLVRYAAADKIETLLRLTRKLQKELDDQLSAKMIDKHG